MKKVKFLKDVPDKNTKEKYKTGEEREFEDTRADEILAARQKNGQPYAILVEDTTPDGVDGEDKEPGKPEDTTSDEVDKDGKELQEDEIVVEENAIIGDENIKDEDVIDVKAEKVTVTKRNSSQKTK